ncbi:glycoside hydrolase superfamily [Aspergillus karnatakaensis]|uniref:glycoside hydrolase family 3 protein n=1 Tax=Aspergillus karnatakaensis TaxID=1810916 RepID=UPI003CCE5362
MAPLIDVDKALRELTLEEKIQLLAGKDTWATHDIPRLSIPSITTSDGPHGVRGIRFFNGPPGSLLPSATAMGATFDRDLMYRVGELLAAEAKEKKCHVILAPTVCLQRSPLIGRGFEAFGEDPTLSGLMASSYINGVQKHGVAVSLKHYAAHDQSSMSLEDSVRASERTLRETHLLPFQLAVKHSNPWSIMTSYHRINGTHVCEDPWLLNKVLRKDWKWDGLVMSDWFGTYSTAEALNAGMDLEMPGPTRWRGELLFWSILARKVKRSTVDFSVRNLLNLINKVSGREESEAAFGEGDSQEKTDLCSQVASSSVVLLKNEKNILPLDPSTKQSYALIGPNVVYPAVSGGGSADLTPYHVSKPLEAVRSVLGEKVKFSPGCWGHIFTPLLQDNIHLPGSREPGYSLSWFGQDPIKNNDAHPVASTTTTQAQMYFADSLPEAVPAAYWLRVETVYRAERSTTMSFGLCVLGRGRMWINDKEVIDLDTSQPEKTLQTPMFNQASMEVTADINVTAGKEYKIVVMLRNGAATASVGALNQGGLRIGCCEKIDPERALAEAVELAKSVDVPIIIAGLNADYESEAVDRKDLKLPPAVDRLIEKIATANPNTVVVTQSGCPIEMPWVQKTGTLVHAWFGGQESGRAIADVLTGKVNPSGRLSVTFPERLEDTPAYLTFGKGSREIFYGEGVFLGYRYYEKVRRPPLFYFGYGLSYTSFEYSNLVVPGTVHLDGGNHSSFEVTVDVQNIGDRDGHEIVQVYIQDIDCEAARPAKELKAFTRVWVPRGETITARLALDKYALSYWNEEEEQWLAERGAFNAIVSRSADPKDHVLIQRFELVADYSWSGV